MNTLRFALGASVGFAFAYLFDPDRGRSRRAQMADMAGARLRRLTDRTRAQLRYQGGKARGVVYEAIRDLRPDPDFDDETLLQKIRSEAIGPWKRDFGADGANLEVIVDEGMVQVKGSSSDLPRLAALIGQVDGVQEVNLVG